MRRAIKIISVLGIVGVGLAGVVWATWPESTPAPDWSGEYDVTARHPGEIPPSTLIGTSPPAGWSNLVIKSLPHVRADQRDKLLSFAADKASWMFTAFVADVVPDVAGSPHRFRLRAAALGLGASVNGRDTILNPDSRELGPIEREILTKGYEVQRKAVMVIHGHTMGLIDTPVWFRCGSANRLVRYRYALLVEPTSGRLDVLLWRLEPDEGNCGGTSEIVRLAPNTIDQAELVIDPAKVRLGLPLEDAFAVEKMPPGTRVPFPPDLLPFATGTRFTPDEAHAMEVRLRNLIHD